MKTLKEIKAWDKVKVIYQGKVAYVATVKMATEHTIILHNGNRYSTKTGKSLNDNTSIEVA